jgi:predicted RND superfamily exporter protein
VDYGKLLDSIETQVTGRLEQLDQAGISAVFTGGIPLFYHAQRQILRDMSTSFLTAFIFISAVMIILLRGFLAGIVAMLPTVFPPIFVFGLMGLLRVPIEIGTVMTASIAFISHSICIPTLREGNLRHDVDL